MHGMQLGDKKLVVQRASVGSKTMPAQVCIIFFLHIKFKLNTNQISELEVSSSISRLNFKNMQKNVISFSVKVVQ